MGRIAAIAGNTFREVVRDRIFYLLLFFAVALILLSKALGWISIEHDTKIITDFSLLGINLFALLITVFLGTNLIYKEVEKKTLYSVLTKDVRRWQFVLGKYFGLLGTSGLCVAGMGAIFFAYLFFMGGMPEWSMAVALWGVLLELALITSISVFFSSVTSPVLSAIITFALFLTGHSVEKVRSFVEELDFQSTDWLMWAVYYAVPNLDNFNFKNFVGNPVPVEAEHVALATLYCLVYSGMLVGFTLIVYRGKDF